MANYRKLPFFDSDHASAGSIHMKVGVAGRGDGGNIELWAGPTDAHHGNHIHPLHPTGGNITMTTGYSVKAHSGNFVMKVRCYSVLI